MKDLRVRGIDTNRVRIEQGVRASPVKKCSASCSLDRHHIGVGGWLLVGPPNQPGIYAEFLTRLQYPVAGLILADDACTGQRKIGSQLREIDQDIAWRAAGSAKFRLDIRQFILTWPRIDDFYVVDDPVAGAKNSSAVTHVEIWRVIEVPKAREGTSDYFNLNSEFEESAVYLLSSVFRFKKPAALSAFTPSCTI